uniref:BLOC-1-related complex subunit 6-like n=1 Tax=Styela clava TaxID=7725 RepID=UPI00193A7522|nr:BLOC-1-related complex subunit 6-like [Styela clava]
MDTSPFAEVAENLSKKGTVTVTGNQLTFVVDNLAEKVKKSSRLMSDDDSSRRTSSCSTPSTSGWSDVPAIDGGILENLEKQTQKLSESLDKIIEKLTKKLHETSAITVGYCQTYSDAANTMGVEADESVKSMYMLIAHCEELDKAMAPVYKVHSKIKHIKTVLAALESQVI